MNTPVSIFLLVEVVLFILLVIVRAFQIHSSDVTNFELKRRAKTRDEVAKHELRKENAVTDLLTIRYLKDTLLVIIITIYTVSVLGWLYGAVVTLGILLAANVVARWNIVITTVQKLYDKYEIKLLSMVEKLHPALKVLRLPSVQPTSDFTIHSKQELKYLIENSDEVLNSDEKHLLAYALDFPEKPVKSVMVPKSAIHSIDKKELLGPLVLDDLHKTGHSRLPVINRDIDHVVGVLHVQDLLTLDTKRSVTVEKAMEAKVYYINQEQSLEYALAAFLQTRHHLFIVINEFRETTGIVTLEDVVEALIGRKIIDEFDTHEDLRAVAERNTLKNNQPKDGVDV